MPWTETSAPNFAARHDSADDDDAVAVLEMLEGTRERLGSVFTRLPETTNVVLHASPLALVLAQPALPFVRALSAPAGRRYLAGWCARREIHVLSPRLLARRASNVAGSREMLMLAPAALYTQLVVATNNRALPPPYGPRGTLRHLRLAWLIAGAAQYFSGQSAYARPAIARRLHEGRTPAFPPALHDAALLGGSIYDMLARERGNEAAVSLAATPATLDSREAVRHAFGERDLAHLAGRWRAHLARIAEP